MVTIFVPTYVLIVRIAVELPPKLDVRCLQASRDEGPVEVV